MTQIRTDSIRKGIITAAGRGTRQYPASRTIQKELFPLVDVDGYAKPTVQIIVEELLASGLEEICIVANPANLEPIRQHFLAPAPRPGKEWMTPLSEALADMAGRLTFVVQETQDGFGHAVYQARAWAGNDPVLLALGDHVSLSDTPVPCARQLLNAFETYGCSVSSVMHVREEDVFRYGILRGTPLPEQTPPVYELQTLVEKPTPEQARTTLRTAGLPDGEYLSHFGFHAFTPTIFECLEELIQTDTRERGEIQLTTAQSLLLKRERYLAAEVQGTRYDMGIPEGLIETQIALALRSPFAARAQANTGRDAVSGGPKRVH